MNRNHICDICDTESESWTEIPITEGWLNEDGYPSGRETSLVICDDCFEKLREMIIQFKEPRTVTYYAGDKPVETVVLDEGKKMTKHIDFEPVRHGRWVLSEDRYWKTCSECKAKVDVSTGLGIFVNDIEVDEMSYCPNCGAKMDEVKEDAN